MADNRMDFRFIVESAANIFEKTNGIHVDRSAREILIDRAVAHEPDVQRSIAEQKLNEDDLINAAINQFKEDLSYRKRYTGGGLIVRLLNLYNEGERSSSLGAVAVLAGMRRKCHWVPWC